MRVNAALSVELTVHFNSKNEIFFVVGWTHDEWKYVSWDKKTDFD